MKIVAASAEVGTQLAVGAITTGGRDRFPEPKNGQLEKHFKNRQLEKNFQKMHFKSSKTHLKI